MWIIVGDTEAPSLMNKRRPLHCKVNAMETMVDPSTGRDGSWAQAEVRFEPGDSPALLDLLDDDPLGDGSMIIMGNPTWIDYYSMLAPGAVKISAGSQEEIQGLILFAEMALQQGTKQLLIADVEGMVKSVGAGWAAFFIRSLVRLGERHRAKVTLTLNPMLLSQTQLEVILGSCGTPTMARNDSSVATPKIEVARRPSVAEILGVVRPITSRAV